MGKGDSRMDIEKFIEDFSKNLPSEPDNNPDLFSIYEEAMLGAGFDFSASERFIEEYILPEMKMLRTEFLKNDKEALSIYRSAGLTDIQVKWRNFRDARLNPLQRRKLKKITEMQILLGDAQLSLVLMREVIIRHRPELAEKYGELQILTLDGV